MEKLISALRRSLSTILYIGYIPGAPGTYGSVLTVVLLWFLRDDATLWLSEPNASLFLPLFILFVIVATWLCNDAKKNFGTSDPGVVVIDEVAGQLITFLFIPLSIPTLLMGFALFRLFDIIKPWPVHAFEEMDEGLGIMMDDVIAGIAACLSLHGMLIVYHAVFNYLT